MPKFSDTGNTAPSIGSLWTPEGRKLSQQQVLVIRDSNQDCSVQNDGGLLFKTMEVPAGATFIETEIYLPTPYNSVCLASQSAAIAGSFWLSFSPMNKQAGYTDAQQTGSEQWLQINGHFLRFCKPFDHCYINLVGPAGNRVTIAFGKLLNDANLY